MAKMFYTLDEAKVALGKSEDEIKQFSRDGRLREFRDGPRLMFKSDQVEALKAQLGGGGGGLTADLGPSDSGAPIGLVDSRGGSASGLSLADSIGSGISGSGLAGMSGAGMGSGLVGSGLAGSGMMNLKEDTALAADLGLSGTVGGMPSPAARGSAGSGTGLSGTAGGRGSVNVFGDDEQADPMAQTAISSAPSVADLNLEAVGSGSGLLDLTRESDDTSLGAEILDEITPGKQRASAPMDTGAMTAVGTPVLDAPRGGITRSTGGSGVSYVEAADPMAEAFGWMAAGAAVVLLFGIFALVAAVYGVTSDWLHFFQGKNIFISLALLAALPLVLFILGMLIGKSRAR